MLVLRELRKQIQDLVNNSGLPIDAVYYVLKDVVLEVERIYNNIANQEENEAAGKETLDETKEESDASKEA